MYTLEHLLLSCYGSCCLLLRRLRWASTCQRGQLCLTVSRNTTAVRWEASTQQNTSRWVWHQQSHMVKTEVQMVVVYRKYGKIRWVKLTWFSRLSTTKIFLWILIYLYVQTSHILPCLSINVRHCERFPVNTSLGWICESIAQRIFPRLQQYHTVGRFGTFTLFKYLEFNKWIDQPKGY